jgi:hypothetical protein
MYIISIFYNEVLGKNLSMYFSTLFKTIEIEVHSFFGIQTTTCKEKPLIKSNKKFQNTITKMVFFN